MANRYSVETIFKAVDRMTGPVSKMQKSIGTFTRKAENSFRSLDRAVAGVNRAMGKVARAGVAAVGVAATATFFALNRMAEKADSLAKQTRRLKFPIEEFQKWQFVAGQGGVESETFSRSMDYFVKVMGDAKAETGGLYTVLNKTNPGLLKQLQNTTDSAEALDIYVKAMRSIEDPAMRASLAAAAFGRSGGAKMSQLADMSAESIKNLMHQMTRNGVITQEQAEAAEAYNDAMDSLKKSIDGFMVDALSPLLPIMTDLFGRLREWTIANREIISGRLTEWLNWLIVNFSEIVGWLKKIGIAIGVWIAFTAILKAFVLVMTAVNLVMALNPIGLIVLGVIAAIAAFSALVIWIDDVVAGFDKLPGVIKVILAPLYALLKGIKFVKDAFKGGLSFAAENFMASFKSDGDDSDGAPQPQTQMVTPQERTAAQINETRTTQENFVTIRDQTGRAEMDKPQRGGFIRIEPMGTFW